MALGTDRLRLRRTEPADFAALAALMAGPKAVAGTLQLPFPSLEIWRERVAKPEPAFVGLVAEARESAEAAFEVVGHADLFSPGSSLRRRHAAGLGIAVRDDWQGRGVGDALMTALLDRADGWMGLLRIELTVFADNAAAVALYRRHGFVVEGTMRAYALRDGAYADAVAMARLHPRPPSLPQASDPT